MFFRWLQAVLLLPGTVLILVPALILHFTVNSLSETIVPPSSPQFVLAIVVSLPGFVLAVWTMFLFVRFGDGTAAPWDPPQKLVVKGPYRHVRNPMISGVLFLLIAETLLFQSTGLLIWTAIFFVGNSCYFPLMEEPGLRKRFGDDYELYFQNVGRWLPRLTPWNLPKEG